MADLPRVSRLEQMKAKKITPPMPPSPLPHLIAWLIEMGLTEAAGMGAAPLSWQTIDAWCARTNIDLSPWESRMIRRLSGEYLSEGRRAEAETCPPPWRAPVTTREIENEEDVLTSVLG